MTRVSWIVIMAGVVLAPLSASLGSLAPPTATPRMDGAGLDFRLREGADDATPPEAVPRAEADILSAADTDALLHRLPPFEGAPAEAPFALREASLPPPRTGTTVLSTFPPAGTPAVPDGGEGGPLRVLRRAPEGAVSLAPSLTVTFSRPMVAVTAAGGPTDVRPVRLTPEPRGQWRWVGTRTLVFQPDGRFPMATRYTATVAAGERSASGERLPAEVSWTFTTPAPRLLSRYPEGGPARRDTLFFAGFDQKIDAAAVLATVRVTGAAKLRLATAEEVGADAVTARLAADSEPGRFLAFRAEGLLPADTDVRVEVGPGTPSSEGPAATTEKQSWTFKTYGPLRIANHQCGWGDTCRPMMPWTVQLTNPIDAKAFRREMVRVEPELPGMKVDVYGDTLRLRGSAKGRTAYRVTLAAGLPDTFGQTLGEDATRTFNVGPATASLSAPGGDFVVLDPYASRRFSVYSVNHGTLRVRLFPVTPGDWPAFRQWVQGTWREERAPDLPGFTATTRSVTVAAAPDEQVETPVDLSAALPNGFGHVVVIVEPERPAKGDRQRVVAWVQATAIGVDAFTDAGSLVAWATSLKDGRPLAGAKVSTVPEGPSLTTDGEGIAKLKLDGVARRAIVVRVGDDTAILPNATGWWSNAGWQERSLERLVRFFAFDDRGLYRPGEEVRVKGWARLLTPGAEGDVLPLGESRRLRYLLTDAQGNEVTKGERPISRVGGFDLTLALPATMNLGDASLRLDLEADGAKGAHIHRIAVQEFRRPEYEVTATASPGPFFPGDATTVSVAAAYFAGGGLPNAEVTWRVAAAPGSFIPPNRDDYTFGTWTPWWGSLRSTAPAPTKRETLEGRTDASGKHRLRVELGTIRPPRATSLTAEATVQDVNRQAWTATARLLVHPAAVYVGLKTERLFVQKGQDIALRAIAVDLDGATVPGRAMEVTAERIDWEQTEGEWRQVSADPQTCRVTSTRDASSCRFTPRQGGTHRITARVEDEKGRPNETQITVWVAGGTAPPDRGVGQEAVTLVPDRKQYAAGDTAQILVLSPFSPAEGLLTLRRGGLVRTERFRMEEGSHTLSVPMIETFTPNVHLQVDVVGAAPRAEGGTDPGKPGVPRPAFASGHLDLSVPPTSRTLALQVRPQTKALEPGGRTTVTVQLKDNSGRPVAGAEVALAVVDEAVLALTGYALPDPVAAFYTRREPGVQDQHLRANVVLGRPEDHGVDLEPQAEQILAGTAAFESPAAPPAPAPAAKAMVQRGRMLAADKPAPAASTPILVRSDFRALALFEAALPTDAQGVARVAVKLPDSLTRYRVMAVAAAPRDDERRGNEFGAGESTLTARLPVMIRPSAPRFLSFGDRFELPVVVQNQTDAPLTVDVAVRAQNADLGDGRGRRLTVPAQNRVEVRFPAAARHAGAARFQVGVASGTFADAADVRLPVWTPATTEAFATYGQIDQGVIAQPVAPPPGAVRGFGGLEITTSSTALQSLTDAVLYLVAYPFECAEQLSSRILAVAALRDVLSAFEAAGLPAPDELQTAVRRDIERLRAIQNADGGFGFWRRGDDSWPYVSIHAALALAVAREKGYEVPAPMLDAAKAYLGDVRQKFPRHYETGTRRTLEAYALHVRARLGDSEPARARALVREAGVEGLSFEALGWLLGVTGGDAASARESDVIRRHLANHVTETAGAAHFVVSYGDQAHLLLHSDRRADAVILEALVRDQPGNDLVPKLVAGLLGHRKAGRWTNTQENVFVLLALDRYFATFEKATPDFVAKAWLGERFAGEHAFRGRTTDRHHVAIPLEAMRETRENLVLAKDGPGRMYYRIGLRYAPASLTLAPTDQGFTVERRYEGADRDDDVRRDADGTWHVRAGSRVRVTLTMVAPGRRTHVALVDPLPAGLEALNPTLATTGTLPAGPSEDVTLFGAPGLGARGIWGHGSWWHRPWYEHQNLRDERVEAFTSLLFEGVYHYSYVARATTPGVFVAGPTKAEEMYAPETFGRSGTDRVVVE